MRRDTLTLQARYVLPVEGPPIEDGSLTIDRGRIAWVGPSSERQGDLDLGNVAIVPGFVNAHTHLELEPLESSRTAAHDESEIPWLRRVIDQRSGPERAIPERDGRSQRPGLDRFGNDLPRRHDHGRAELGVDRRGPSTCPRLRRADRAQARPRARDMRIGLEMARLGPPRNAGRGLRQAGSEPACPL